MPVLFVIMLMLNILNVFSPPSPQPFVHSSVSHLHDRWLKDCAFYRDIYEPVNDVELKPRIDWASVLNQKQVKSSVLFFFGN